MQLQQLTGFWNGTLKLVNQIKERTKIDHHLEREKKKRTQKVFTELYRVQK